MALRSGLRVPTVAPPALGLTTVVLNQSTRASPTRYALGFGEGVLVVPFLVLLT